MSKVFKGFIIQIKVDFKQITDVKIIFNWTLPTSYYFNIIFITKQITQCSKIIT